MEGSCPVDNVLVTHNSNIMPAWEPKGGRTVLRIAVEQVNNVSAFVNCSLHHLCSTVFPQCADRNMSRHEAANNTVTIKLSDSCALHSDLLMTLASMTTGTDADVVSIANEESMSWNGSRSVECHPQYTPVCGLCVPHCSRYHVNLRTNGGWNLEDEAVTAASAICVLGGVIFIALSIARRKEM